MSEQAVRVELDHRERTAEAKTDTKFERVLGEMRASFATLGGKIDTANAEALGRTDALKARIDALPGRVTFFLTVIAIALAVAGVGVAVMQFGGAMFGNGFTSYPIAREAAQDALRGK